MSASKRGNRHQHLNTDHIPPSVGSNHPEEPPHTNESQHDEADERYSKAIKANVSIIEDNKWTRAEKMAAIAIFVSVVMFAVTYSLFYQSLTQSKAAMKSANAAVTADSLTKVYNDSSLHVQNTSLDSQIAAKKQSEISDIQKSQRETAASNLQKEALDAQISYIKQSRDLFEKENQPYLQVVIDTGRLKIQGNDIIKIGYRVKALCKIPIQTTDRAVRIDFSPFKVDTFAFIKTIEKRLIETKPNNDYFYGTDNPPYSFEYPDPGNILSKEIIFNKLFFYVSGRFKYVNYLNNKIRIYDFILMLSSTNGQISGRYLLNRNYDVKLPSATASVPLVVRR